MKKVRPEESILEVVAVLLVIFCSNSVVFHQMYGKYTTPAFLLYAVILYIIKSKKYILTLRNCGILALLLIGMVIPTLLGNPGGLLSNDFIILVLFLVGMFFFAESMSYKSFRRIYINILTLMSAYSVAVFFLFQFGALKSRYQLVGNVDYVMCFGENMGWFINYKRIAGPFWEGGAYQIFLNIAIFFKLDSLISIHIRRKDFLQVLMMAACVILTKSTAGCIILAYLLVIYLPKLNIKIIAARQKRVLFFLISLIMSISLLTSDTVVNKFNSNNLSYARRSEDIYNSIMLITKKPIVGTGYYSDIAQKIIGTNSNGILEICVYFGIPFLVLYFCVVLANLKHHEYNVKRIYIIGMLVFINFTECVYTLPIMLIFIFKFKQDITLQENSNENLNKLPGTQ